MDKLKEEILKLTENNKILTEKQLFRLLRVYKVKFSFINYDIISDFLKDNDIKLISNEENEKKYALFN